MKKTIRMYGFFHGLLIIIVERGYTCTIGTFQVSKTYKI